MIEIQSVTWKVKYTKWLTLILEDMYVLTEKNSCNIEFFESYIFFLICWIDMIKKTLNYLAMVGSHQDIKWKMTWNVRSHALDFWQKVSKYNFISFSVV